MSLASRRAVLGLIILLAIPLMVELGYRLTKGPVPNPRKNLDPLCLQDEKLGYRFKPGAVSPQGRDVNCINNVGLRGQDISVPKAKNVFRILCVGDSSTNGVNVRNNETYPGILQQLFAQSQFKDNVRVEVVNAGVPGYVSDHQRYLLEHKYLDLEPDLIIFMMGVTDVTVTLEPSELSDAIRGIHRDTKLLPTGLHDFLQTHSSAYYWGSRQLQNALDLRKLEATGKKDLSKEIQDELRSYQANYQAMIETCKEHGVEVININTPWNFTSKVGREDNFTPLKNMIKYFEFNLYWQAMPILGQINKDIADRNGIPNLDLQPCILRSKNRLLFFGENDFTHPSIAGNFLIASQVYAYIVSHMLADRMTSRADGFEQAGRYLLGMPLDN